MAQDENKSMTFWEELKRRKVVRVVIAYLVVGWGLIQIADVTLEPLHLPEWSDTLVVWLVALGFPIAIVLAWILDVTPRGIEVTAAASDDDSASPPDASIAVLPFVNMSGNPDNEYFSDGLSEELLNLLVRLQSVRVCSRTSSFSLKGKDIDMTTIAAQLGVRHVLQGSVRRDGDKVRITAQLIDAVADRHLWSETYNRDLQDIFAVQDEIAGHIFNALQLKLTADEKRAVRSTTESAEALDYYLHGRELYHRPGHLDQSREKFEEAIRIDPNYALAWAGLTYVFIDTYWYRDKEPKWLDRANEASLKAIELAPHLAESHGARGLALRASEQFDAARAEFEKAIEINPRLFEPIHFYAQMARSLDQYAFAANLFCQAAAVRTEDYQALALAANMYEAIDDTAQAEALSREAIPRAERAIELNPDDSRAWVLGASCLLRIGEPDKAMEWIDRAREVAPKSSGVAYNSACVFAKLGKTDRALALIKESVDLGNHNRRYFETDPDFKRFRDDPRFQEILDSI